MANILKPDEGLYVIARANCIFKYFKNADITDKYILKINTKDMLISQNSEETAQVLYKLHTKLAEHYLHEAKQYRNQDQKTRDFSNDYQKSESQRIEKLIDDYTKNACKEILQILRVHNSKDTTFIEKLSNYIGENNYVLLDEHNSSEMFGLSCSHVEQSNQTTTVEDKDDIGASLLGGSEIADNHT